MDRLQAMSAFVRVVETGSFSSAARLLNLGQPSVSKIIAQLEDRLQVTLLSRTTRGLSATEAGLRFFERAKTVIQEADEAELDARGAGAGLTGCLRISATTTFARLFIVPLLPQFLEQHPDLTIDVILDDRVIDLVEEGVDLSLRISGRLPDSSSIARKIAKGSFHVLGTPRYFERAGVPKKPSDLASHEAVIYSQLPTGWSFMRDGASTSVTLTGRVRVSAAEGVRTAVLADMGLTIGSYWMFAPELESGAAITVLPEWTLPPVDVWAIFPPGRIPTAKARRFASFAEEALNSGLDRLS
ncbi:MAG: LysR family transcriptional regulator [Proteobacteria bacterium]|nr:LysR family transcriptional regulator [Pseudomonadota bacterium]